MRSAKPRFSRLSVVAGWLLAASCGPHTPVQTFEGIDSPDPEIRAEAERRVAENIHEIAENIEGGGDFSRSQIDRAGQMLSRSLDGSGTSDETRRDATASLARLGWDMPDEAVPKLFDALDDPDPFVRAYAVTGIYRWAKRNRIDREQAQRWRPAAKDTAAMLTTWLDDSDPLVRTRAARIARDLEGSARQAEGALVRALDDEEENVRIHAAWALVEMHSRAQPLTNAQLVQHMADDPHKDVRSGLALVISYRGAEIVPELVGMLSADGWEQRKDAAFALGEIGAPARSALPALRAALDGAILFEASTMERAIEKIEGRATPDG